MRTQKSLLVCSLVGLCSIPALAAETEWSGTLGWDAYYYDSKSDNSSFGDNTEMGQIFSLDFNGQRNGDYLDYGADFTADLTNQLIDKFDVDPGFTGGAETTLHSFSNLAGVTLYAQGQPLSEYNDSNSANPVSNISYTLGVKPYLNIPLGGKTQIQMNSGNSLLFAPNGFSEIDQREHEGNVALVRQVGQSEKASLSYNIKYVWDQDVNSDDDGDIVYDTNGDGVIIDDPADPLADEARGTDPTYETLIHSGRIRFQGGGRFLRHDIALGMDFAENTDLDDDSSISDSTIAGKIGFNYTNDNLQVNFGVSRGMTTRIDQLTDEVDDIDTLSNADSIDPYDTYNSLTIQNSAYISMETNGICRTCTVDASLEGIINQYIYDDADLDELQAALGDNNDATEDSQLVFDIGLTREVATGYDARFGYQNKIVFIDGDFGDVDYQENSLNATVGVVLSRKFKWDTSAEVSLDGDDNSVDWTVQSGVRYLLNGTY